jgi:hypothetical protein
MKPYRVLVNQITYDKAKMYLEKLLAEKRAGKYLQEQSHNKALSSHITIEEFLKSLQKAPSLAMGQTGIKKNFQY